MSGVQQGLLASNNAPPRTYATWNPSDKATAVSLSSGNLVAGYTSNSAWGTVRSNIGKTSGKWYSEFTITSLGTDNFFIGVGTVRTTNFIMGQSADSISYTSEGAGGTKMISIGSDFGPSSAYGADFTQGDIIGIALDKDNNTVTFYKNGVSQGAISGTISGTTYMGISMRWTNQSITANFGSSAFAYSVPSGYNSGLYT